MRNTPKVVGGMTPECTERAAEVYGRVCEHVVRVSSPEVAEMTKLLENIFRSVNIALVNELSMLADRMNLDIWEVVDAASTKPYGFMRFEPGPGMGGHCLPVDPFYLTWRAREFHMSTEFIELAGKINQQMPYVCTERIEWALNEAEKPVKGSKILILGASYKGGVGDIRESPSVRIIEVLQGRGAHVSYSDPYVPELRKHGLNSVSLEAAIGDADAVVLVTAHPGIDYGMVLERSAVLVDLRGVTRKLSRSAAETPVVTERERAAAVARAGCRLARSDAELLQRVVCALCQPRCRHFRRHGEGRLQPPISPCLSRSTP